MLSNLAKHTHGRAFIGADPDDSAPVVIFCNDPAPCTANAADAFFFLNRFVQVFSFESIIVPVLVNEVGGQFPPHDEFFPKRCLGRIQIMTCFILTEPMIPLGMHTSREVLV
jgi:hypothetical protein